MRKKNRDFHVFLLFYNYFCILNGVIPSSNISDNITTDDTKTSKKLSDKPTTIIIITKY